MERPLATQRRTSVKLHQMAVAMTAYKRPYYLKQTLGSWSAAVGVGALAVFRVALEPSAVEREMAEVAGDAFCMVDMEVVTNPRRLGVLVNPAEAVNGVFRDYPEVRFVVLAEEDVIVSSDTMRYMRWAATEFENDQSVGLVCAMPRFHGDDPHIVRRYPYMSGNLVWGTWRDRWEKLIYPTWDRDYSTGDSEQSGAGWDYNLDWRILPRNGLCSVAPDMSRSQHIGKFEGEHCSAAEFPLTQVTSFRERFEPGTFRMGETHGPARSS